MKKPSFTYLFPVALLMVSCTQEPDRLQEAMDRFQLEPGLRIELVAAEPLVIDPVALAFDEDQRMYVVEDRGYPDPVEGGGTATTEGRVVRLEDTDGDGRYDRRTEFATGFTYPNGVLPWRGGVFVTCAPDIFYLKDTDDDGIADVRKVVLTGFKDTKTSQLRMSYPTLGLDGWVYVTGGLNGGEITSPEHPDRPAVSYTSADGRFHPETLEFEITGGKSQFGLTFDTYGRRFGCSNRHPMQHVVLEPWYLSRNPHLSFTETIKNVSKAEAEATVFPISDATTTADFIPNLIGRSHAGTFTSACGLLVFKGTGLTPEHQGNAFICEPAQNLVQRQVMHSDGVSFRSEVPYEGREFLASTDTWFNPVFLRSGPEGALYLADMHRKVIDHPAYVPEEKRKEMDFESGKDKGRIYRIVREGFRDLSDDASALSTTNSTTQLVQALESPQEWERATAHRLLLERRDSTLVPQLRQLAGAASLPGSRTRALWLLRSLGGLDAATVKVALADPEAGVREQAVLLAQELGEESEEIVQMLVATATDENARVRFTAALALGALEGPQVTPALATIAAQDGDDRWVRAAVLSGVGSRLPEFLADFRAQRAADPEAFAAVMQDLGQLFGNGASLADCRELLRDVIASDGDYRWRIATALGLAEGISLRRERETAQKGPLYTLLSPQASAAGQKMLDQFIAGVAARANDEETKISQRILAARLLGYTNFEQSGAVLQELLDARNPPELQLGAVAALAQQDNAKAGTLLTEESTWTSYTPRVRSAVIAALVSKPTLIGVLFDAIEQGVVTASDISSVDRRRLMENDDEKISTQAEVLFKELEGGERMQVYEDYRQTLTSSADAASGKSVFQQSCSACHSYAGEGGQVGPDLTGVKNQPTDALLLHTLVPNYEVYPTYQAISVETSDGRSLSGRLIAETENSLTLRTAFGTDESILRTNIISLTNTGRSLMPDGLEQRMTQDELAQLIAYLKSGG